MTPGAATGWTGVALLVLGLGAVGLEAQDVSGTSSLIATGGQSQFWYSGRQLRHPLVVELTADDASTCARRRVSFDAGGDGAVSPRIASGSWDGERCLAEGWWQLGATIGVQHASASVVDAGTGEAVTFQAIARQGARIFFGGAWTPREEAWVELVKSQDGPARLREVAAGGVFRSLIGVDFPLRPAWRRVRVAVGASAQELDRFFYFGASALQGFILGPSQESSAVDVHLGIQLSRRDIGISGAPCAPDPVCTRRDLRFSGLTLLLTIDGASAFRGLAGAVLR